MNSLRVLVVSAAPRVSTRSDTESLGPRSHLLGLIGGFTGCGAEVHTVILGDLPLLARSGQPGTERHLSAHLHSLVAADVLRLLVRLFATIYGRIVVRRQYDIVYERYGLYQAFGRSLRRRARATWVLEVNALLAVEATGTRRATVSRRLARFTEGRTFRACDQIVAVSHDLARSVIQTYGIPSVKVVVISNGVDCSRFDTGNAAMRVSGTARRIGFVGSLYGWQNVDALFDAVGELPDGDLVEVVVAGDGPCRDALERHRLVVSGRTAVTFLGRIPPDDVPALLASFDLCYAGHQAEGGVYFSPLKVWEYLAAGNPVIVSDQPKLRELEREGYAVAPFAPGGLTAVLAAVLLDLDRYRTVAWADRTRVCEQHSWRARVADLVDVVAPGRATGPPRGGEPG